MLESHRAFSDAIFSFQKVHLPMSTLNTNTSASYLQPDSLPTQSLSSLAM